MSARLEISYDGKTPTLSWSPYIPFPLTYKCYRAPGPDGDWELLTPGEGIALTQFTDNNRLWSSNNRHYYKVVAMVGAAEVEWVPPTLWVPQARQENVNRILAEINRRHESLVLDKFAGEACSLYLRKAAGTPCPNGCSVGDAHVMKYQGEYCPTCFNTGIEGGFVKVDDQLIRVRNAQQDVELRQDGIAFTEGRTAWMGAAPLVGSGDWFVRGTGERFGITNVRRRELQGVVTLQIMNIKEVESQQYLYDITDAMIN